MLHRQLSRETGNSELALSDVTYIFPARFYGVTPFQCSVDGERMGPEATPSVMR